MVARMNVESIKEYFVAFSKRVNSSDGIILTIGIFALILGILIDVFIIRLLCLFVVMGAAVLLFATLRAKEHVEMDRSGSANAQSTPQFQDDLMKKIVFDDFQTDGGGTYVVGESIDHGEPAFTHVSSYQPMQPPVSIALGGDAAVFAGIKQDLETAPRQFHISDFFDIDCAIYKGETEPRTEFDFLLNKVLILIKEVLFAHTVVFFWANREKQQMVMEARMTESGRFMTSRRFSIGHDLVSKVAETGKPELVSEVNPVSERELFPYYDSPESVKSFIGVPVFYSRTSDVHAVEQPVAVIAIDSKVEDQFGEETLALLGNYTKLISALIKTYNDKYDLLLDAELLKSIRRLQEKIRNSFSLATMLQALMEETSKLINWDFLSVVLYDENKHAWVAKKVSNRAHDGYLVPEQAIDFPASIVGETIKHNAHRFIDDIEQSVIPRYFKDEKLQYKGSFISIPMSSLNKCYGALSLESRDKFNFTRRDIEMLYRLAENVAAALEIYYLQEVINEYVIVDENTGVYSKKFFLQRVEEELARADENGTELSMLFITIDRSNDVTGRFGREGFERVMMTLAKAIRASVRSYDIVGRYDINEFGVVLLNTPANDAYVWAEKIRKSVAGHVINIEGKSFSITISVGVGGALEGMRKEELVGNTITVLHKATEAGGNLVRVY